MGEQKMDKIRLTVLGSMIIVLVFLITGIVQPLLCIAEEKKEAALIPPKLRKLNIINSLDRFYDVAVAGKHIWLAGHYGKVLYSSDGGQTWEVQETGVSKPLFGITAINEKKILIVGDEGLVISTQDGGKTWKKAESGTKDQLFSVAFMNENRGWIVGSFGTILLTDDGGTTWRNIVLDLVIQENPDEIPIVPMLNHIFFLDELNGWIVGEKGTVLNTTDGGKTWTTKNSGIVGTYLESVFFRTPEEGMIVGEQGLGFLTRNSGETWEKISITTSGSLFNVIGANDHYLIAGDFGEIFIVNTNTLKPEPLLPYRISPNWFSAVEVSSAGDFIVACGWGQILVSSPVAKHSRTTVFVPFN